MVSWTWEQYKVWVSQNTQNNYQFLYRGQADAQWVLQPSLFRSPSPVDLNIYVYNIVPELHNQLTTKGFEHYNLQDINSFNTFLAKLQHHGFPTPLLDWTYSPYISVFFAINEKTNGTHFSIYAFDYMKWISSFYQPIDLLNSNPFVSTFKPYNFNNPRLMTQQSVLTVTNISNIEEHLLNVGRNNPKPYLYKIDISKNEIQKIKNDLYQMGITKEVLFPDLDTICKMFKSNYFNE